MYSWLKRQIILTDVDAKHVAKHFQATKDGFALYYWILSHHTPETDASEQKLLMSRYNALVAPASSSVQQLQIMFKEHHSLWHSISTLKVQALSDEIAAVLGKIDSQHPAQTYIQTMQTIALVQTPSPWNTWNAFTVQLIEYLKLQLPIVDAAAPGAFAFGRKAGGKKGGGDKSGGAKYENDCKSCDLHYCKAKKDTAKCYACTDSLELPESLSSRAVKFTKIYRSYRKSKNLTSMKGVTVPQGFSKTEASGSPADNAGEQPASLPLAETMDDAFWQSLHDGTSHAFFALGMVEQDSIEEVASDAATSGLADVDEQCIAEEPAPPAQHVPFSSHQWYTIDQGAHQGVIYINPDSAEGKQKLATSVLAGATVVAFGNNSAAQQLAQQHWRSTMEKFTSPSQPEQPSSLNPRTAPYSATSESISRVPPSTRVFSNMPTRELFTRSPEQLAAPSRAQQEPPEVISDISKQVHDALLESRDMQTTTIEMIRESSRERNSVLQA